MATPVRPTRIPRTSYSTALVVLLFAVAAIAVPYSVGSRSRVESTPRVGPSSAPIIAHPNMWFPTAASLAGETVEVFAADCSTPLNEMNLGEIVCAKTNGVNLTLPNNHYMNWIDSSLNETSGGTITQNPQFFYFTPPTTGLWKATIGSVAPLDSSIIENPPLFTVNSGVGIATYAPNCTTPKTTFTLGDVVCAKVSGADQFNRSIGWVDPSGLTRTFTPITTDPQTDSFTLPATNTSTIDIFVVDNRGQWQVNVVSSRGSIVRSQSFQVQGNAPTADLSIAKSLVGESPDSGGTVTFAIAVTNNGPNAAENVEISDAQPANATFVSASQTSGPAFSCTGSNPVVCTRGTTGSPLFLNPGEIAVFEFVYTASGASGSSITNVATVESDTTELNQTDNTAIYGPITIGGGGGTPAECVLDCPPNMTVAANTTQSGNPAAVVTFANAEAIGNCGTVTANPASGSTFPQGTTVVMVSSSVGGGSCTFTVTVVAAAAPTITCPANQTVAAGSGQSEATVSVGTPSATGSNVVLSSERSDERPVSDPYPVGTTFITWTATDQFGRTATCTQTITVTSEDAPTISCPSNKTFTSPDGCMYTATAGEIGTPTTTGPGVVVTSERSDGLALTDAYPAGVTSIEWTATNSVGSASCTQTITVIGNDTEDPTLQTPPSITTSTDQCSVLLDDEQFVAEAEDNCSSSVTISRTGMPQIACPVPGNPGRMCDSFVFPTGTTVITYTATDSAGNSTSGMQTVTVNENPNTPPTISAPADLTVFTGPGATSCTVVVGDATLGTATASDNCPGVVVTRTGVPAGNIFPVGNTVITYRATDRVGNFTEDTQTVTVVDTTPPVISCPANITQNTDPGLCSATINPGTATATDNCDSNPTIVGTRSDSQPLNAPYPKGVTTITWTATDHASPTPNQSSCMQTITVEDHENPTISCPADIIADYNPAVNGAVVTYTPPVGADNCPGAVTVQTAGLASGSTFPVGTTTNTFTVTDASGNSFSCSFKVTVAITSVIGLDSASLTGNVLVDSYNSSGGYPATKGSLANLFSNGTLSVLGSSKMFGNVRSTRVGVSVQGTSQVNGNATAGTTVSKGASATITGTITNNALAPVMTLPSVTACGPPYSPNSGISGTYSYNPATGNLTLSGINIATLANGNYCFNNITLTNSAQLRVNGPVTIKMTGTFSAGGASSANNTTLIPANLRILSSYSGANGVSFSNGNSAYLLIYAPTTNVANTGSAPLFGTVVGKTVVISNSGMLHYDTQLKALWPELWTLIIGP